MVDSIRLSVDNEYSVDCYYDSVSNHVVARRRLHIDLKHFGRAELFSGVNNCYEFICNYLHSKAVPNTCILCTTYLFSTGCSFELHLVSARFQEPSKKESVSGSHNDRISCCGHDIFHMYLVVHPCYERDHSCDFYGVPDQGI